MTKTHPQSGFAPVAGIHSFPLSTLPRANFLPLTGRPLFMFTTQQAHISFFYFTVINLLLLHEKPSFY